MRDPFDTRGNLEATEVCASEDIARVGRRRHKANVDGHSRVQAYAARLYGRGECCLFDQKFQPEPFSIVVSEMTLSSVR